MRGGRGGGESAAVDRGGGERGGTGTDGRERKNVRLNFERESRRVIVDDHSGVYYQHTPNKGEGRMRPPAILFLSLLSPHPPSFILPPPS